MQDSRPFLEEPLAWHIPPPSASRSGCRRGRPKSRQVLSLSDNVSSTLPVLPQPVEPCGTEEQREKNQETPEQEFIVQPEEEERDGPTREGKKRGAEAEEETSDDATVVKRVCFEQMPQPASETCMSRSESADFEQAAIEDIIDVETVSLTSVGDGLQKEEQEEKPVWTGIKLRDTEECLTDEAKESSSDEIIDVEGDVEDDHSQSRAAPISNSPPFRSADGLESTGSWDGDKGEDNDVIGGSGPVPGPVTISWTESSEGMKEEEDEDVGVVGEKTTYTSSVAIATVS